MKILLTKDIQLGKKGDIVSVSQPRGNYLINKMGVAKLHVATVEVEEEEEKPKPKKEAKPKTKTKK